MTQGWSCEHDPLHCRHIPELVTHLVSCHRATSLTLWLQCGISRPLLCVSFPSLPLFLQVPGVVSSGCVFVKIICACFPNAILLGVVLASGKKQTLNVGAQGCNVMLHFIRWPTFSCCFVRPYMALSRPSG